MESRPRQLELTVDVPIGTAMFLWFMDICVATNVIPIVFVRRHHHPTENQDAECLNECLQENALGWSKSTEFMRRERVLQYYSADKLEKDGHQRC